MKYGLCVGINDYPGTGADLRGCVNDANDWYAFLKAQGYNCTQLLDAQATKAAVLDELAWMINEASFGDRIAFTYSGHGTWLPDRDGDEIDGRDEALVMHDYEAGGYLTDDELHALMSKAKFGVRIIVVSDSCHSGTMQRFFGPGGAAAQPTVGSNPRFLSPAILPNVEVRSLEEAAEAEATSPVNRSRVNGGMVLMSGCSDEEYSYDAFISGRPRGAFTWAAMEGLAAGKTRMGQLHSHVRSLLPSSSYPQSPQLQLAKKHQRYWAF